jgi:acetyl-CoA decarbonylase/synthase complex subunit alpha
MQNITSLREWDFLLLKRYPPKYLKTEDECTLCAHGPCRIDKKKNGACGIKLHAHLSRMSLFTAVTGAAGHASLAETIASELIEKFGKDFPLTLSNGESAQTPLIRLICGFKPKTLSDMKTVTSYINKEITSLLSVLNMGQEGDWRDFESKTLHAGMLDNLALEAADISQIAAFQFPSNSPDTPVIPLNPPLIKGERGGLLPLLNGEKGGLPPLEKGGEGENKKPAILCIGHSSITGIEIMEYIEEITPPCEGGDTGGVIDLYGLCCMAYDMSRLPSPHPSPQMGERPGVKIAGNQRDQIKFIKSGIADVIVLDSQCIRTDIIDYASEIGIPVIATSHECCMGLPDRTDDNLKNIVDELISKKEKGVLIFDKKKIAKAAVETAIKGARGKGQGARVNNKAYKIRIGRGAISDTEIKNIAPPIIMGEIPGIIGLLGCPDYAVNELSEIARTLIERDYIVTSGGCAAIDLANVNGKSLYEETSGRFDAGGFANLGSCISASHLLGAAVKIAGVMLHRSIDGNYKEIADYILTRVGVVIIILGPISQKAYATATGANRLGIPVIFGRRGERYGRLLNGDKNCKWEVRDMRNKRSVFAGPVPEHLLTVADTPFEALILAAKLCMRPNDTSKGRQVKLKNYIELSKNGIPDDIHLFIRTEYDIPHEYKNIIYPKLKEINWKPVWIPDPTLLTPA